MRAVGGAAGGIDVVASIGMWLVLLTGLIALVQVAQTWLAVQRAARDAVLGVATYGCWTPAVTTMVQQDLAHAPDLGRGVTVATTAGVVPALDVDAANDPSESVTITAPVVVRWFAVQSPITFQFTSTAAATSAAVFKSPTAGGGGGCTTPVG